MKKALSLILAVLLCLGTLAALASCKKEDTGDDYTKIPDTMESKDGKYELAFVTDVGQLLDKSFNQGTWEGLKKYAYDNDKSYKYYQPANGDKATDEDRADAMRAACNGGAKVVVAAGFMQGAALATVASEFPDVKFVFIDGNPILADEESGEMMENVAGITFREEQAGYLAGYAVVMEGYTKLGFCGGGAGENPACCRFGYGFVQGAEAAAAEKNVKVEMKYSWLYGTSFSPSAELQTMVNGWYTNGTEVVFSCGGNMCQSVFAAASTNNGKVVGVDVDQSGQSGTVITSAMKGLREAVQEVLTAFYAGKWSDLGGKDTSYGAESGAVGLPTDTWTMKNFTVENYNNLFAKLKNGSVKPDTDYSKLDSTEHVTLDIVK